MTKEEYPGIPDRIGDYYLTDFDKNLMRIIKELEERIIALEKSRKPDREYVTHCDDAYYWEHG